MKIKFLCIVLIAICLSFISVSGCASKQKKKKSVTVLDERIRLYGRLLRWKEYEGAVALIKHQDESSVDIDLAAYKDLRVTDYEIKKVKLGEEFKTAKVEAEITYYFETTNSVTTIRDMQSWWYKEEAETWFLDDDFPAF